MKAPVIPANAPTIVPLMIVAASVFDGFCAFLFGNIPFGCDELDVVLFLVLRKFLFFEANNVVHILVIAIVRLE